MRPPVLAVLSAFTLCVGLKCPLTAQEDARPPALSNPIEGLDEYILKSMAEWQIPGLAVAIVKDDSVVFTKGYGVREAGKATPVDAQTVFAIGSTTKAFTAASVAILVDEGRVSWDDPVIKHLPWFRLPDPWVTQHATIRDLLAHRLAGDVGSSTGRMYDWPNPMEREELLRKLHLLEVGSPGFRSRFVYCNECYMAAAELVAAVAQMSWEDFVKERIFSPLQMSSATTSVYDFWDAAFVSPCWVCRLEGITVGAEDARLENVVMPHAPSDSGPRPIPWMAVETGAPAGGLNMSVEDLAKWVRMLLNGGVSQGDRLLSQAVVNEMHSPMVITQPPVWYYPMLSQGGDVAGHFWAYGFGWNLTDYRGRKVVLHGGGVVGQGSFIAMLPEESIGVAVLSNGEGALPMALPFRVFDAYLGAPDVDWSGAMLGGFRFWEAQQKAQQERLAGERVLGIVPRFPLEVCVGTYAHPAYGEVEVVLGDGGLVLRFSDQFSWPLEPWDQSTFRVPFASESNQYPMFLTFDADDSGQVRALTLGGQRYERVLLHGYL